MTKTDATAFVGWLDALLAERQTMKSLIARLYHARMLADRAAATATEVRICALVLDSLNLYKRSSPAPGFLAAAVCELPDIFSRPRCTENPVHAFDYPVGGLVITNHALQDRLIALLAPLDYVLAQRRSPHVL